MNGSDCGMFTCKYADYITKDKPITFTQVTSATNNTLRRVLSSWAAPSESFLLTETHALLQKTDGLGDFKPQTLVMSLVQLAHLCVRCWNRFSGGFARDGSLLFWERLAHQLLFSGTSFVVFFLSPWSFTRQTADVEMRRFQSLPPSPPIIHRNKKIYNTVQPRQNWFWIHTRADLQLFTEVHFLTRMKPLMCAGIVIFTKNCSFCKTKGLPIINWSLYDWQHLLIFVRNPKK